MGSLMTRHTADVLLPREEWQTIREALLLATMLGMGDEDDAERLRRVISKLDTRLPREWEPPTCIVLAAGGQRVIVEPLGTDDSGPVVDDDVDVDEDARPRTAEVAGDAIAAMEAAGFKVIAIDDPDAAPVAYADVLGGRAARCESISSTGARCIRPAGHALGDPLHFVGNVEWLD